MPIRKLDVRPAQLVRLVVECHVCASTVLGTTSVVLSVGHERMLRVFVWLSRTSWFVLLRLHTPSTVLRVILTVVHDRERCCPVLRIWKGWIP